MSPSFQTMNRIVENLFIFMHLILTAHESVACERFVEHF